MSLQITVAGNGFPQQELPQDRIPAAKAVQSRSAEVKAVMEKVRLSLPGKRDGESGSAPEAAIMADLEKITLAFNKKLKFEVNHNSNDVVVKVIDPETDKVIKVLPPEELQRLHSRLKETIGYLFDERI